MQRPPRHAVLISLILLAAVFAGCVDEGVVDTRPPAAERATADPFAGFALAEGTLIAKNATEARFRWEGTGGAGVAGATGGSPTALFAVPAGPDVVITTTLRWDDPASDLELMVRGPDGKKRCASSNGPGGFVDPVESCRAGARLGRADEAWAIEVVLFDNRNPGLKFTVDVLVALPTLPAIDPAVAARFTEPVRVGTGADSETSLFIADDGTMLACTHGAFRKPSPLWASTDAGVTWREIAVEPNPAPSGDCDVAISDDGTWYMMYNTLASATVASSTDQGETWQVQPVAAYPVAGAVDRPWLLADGNDITLTYANAAAALPAAQFFTRSTDRGLTWPVHTLMGRAEDADKIQKIPGHPINWNDGKEILAPTLTRAQADFIPVGDSFLVLHRSHDSGATWAPHTVAGPFQSGLGFPGAARSPDGTLYLTYGRGHVANSSVEVIWSHDDGATWSEPLVVAKEVAMAMVFSAFVDARPDGSATIAWLQVAGDGQRMPGYQVWVARVDAHADEPLVYAGGITEPYDGEFGYEYIMMRHDAAGRAHVAYVEEGEGCADDPSTTRRSQCLYIMSERDGIAD